MSQTFDPENSGQAGENQGGQGSAAGHGQGYPYGYPAPQGYQAAPGAAGWAGGAGGSWYAGGPGYGSVPPMPPRGSRKRGLVVTGVVALAAGAALGGLIGSMDHTVAGAVTATSKTALTSSQIAARVDPALVDVVSTDSLQGATSEGTGIVLTSTGEVLTNNHVIEGATSIKAIDIGNGRTYTATVVGYDASHDVAVIQLQNASGLTTASLGDSATVQTGDSVTALGNAEGKEGTPAVATGTVTALNQSITASDELASVSEQLTGLIETNAPIQPGDSGGPLVNSYGQVIGMDTAASSNYQFQNQSSTATQAYAIPINDALSIAKQIEAGTTSADVHIGATAFLGLEIGGSNTNSGGFGGFGGSGGFGGQNSQTTTSGVTIAGTVSGSPAANAGLTAGDTITAIAGQSVSAAETVAHTLVKYHPGDSISVSWTDTAGQSHTANLTLTTGPAA
ncbi:MAG TPA: trypsin-like peptidase domain-containing protein [Streptosporangiaceae bacterium]|nr:trypsin-like peptidase domain-containing protein [Streptosporangiaceae bacterium]